MCNGCLFSQKQAGELSSRGWVGALIYGLSIGLNHILYRALEVQKCSFKARSQILFL